MAERAGFNSRAHGARDHLRPVHAAHVVVSIHARTGRATASFRAFPSSCRFQFTRARGARQTPPEPGTVRTVFQFTRARGARPSTIGAWPWTRCFNSRAHGARDGTLCARKGGEDVSIHARTGRATRHELHHDKDGSFNSRAHGARDDGPVHAPPQRMVSIHARTGRATPARPPPLRWACFNSRAHGARDEAPLPAVQAHQFQFTRARGARRRARRTAPGLGWFQFTRARGARPSA